MSDELRLRLRQEQTQLLRGLLLSGPVPAGFDAARVELTASLLIEKRWRHVSHVRPVLVRSLGPTGRQRFEHHAREHTFPPADAQADALCFFRGVTRTTALPRDAVREQAVALARFRRRRRRAVLRRLSCASRLLRHPGSVR